MNKTWYIDYETRTDEKCDLNKYGGRIYSKNPSTEIMISSLIDPDGNEHIWLPIVKPEFDKSKFPWPNTYLGSDVPSIWKDIPSDDYLCGHNISGFDRHIHNRFVKQHDKIKDTMFMTRAFNITGSLDKAAMFFGLPGKNEEAVSILKRVCKIKRIERGKYVKLLKVQPNFSELVKLTDYCLNDTRTTKFFDFKLGSLYEYELSEVDQYINDLGFRIDKQALAQLIKAYRTIVTHAKAEIVIASEFNIAKAGSHKQVQKYLRSLGFALPNLQKETINRFMEDWEIFADGFATEDEYVKAVNILGLRKEAMANALRKLELIATMLVFDSRIKDCFQKNKAHTGRWTGKGVQPHTFPRSGKIDQEAIVQALDKNELTIDFITEEAAKCKPEPEDRSVSMRGLLKYVIIPEDNHEFGIADYGAIEARGVAWLFGCKKLLAAFSDPSKDVYVEQANILGLDGKVKENRFIGKTIILGCGYGMGVQAFAEKCVNLWNINLRALNLTAEDCVKSSYRKAYPEISTGWYNIDDMVKWCISNPGNREFLFEKRLGILSDGKTLELRLPSGRCLYYQDVMYDVELNSVSYASDFGPRKHLYGGLLTENIVQGFSRDFLAHALCILRKKGFKIPLHVHDEIVCEFLKSLRKEKLHEMCAIISTPPSWALDFPLRVEGFTGHRYSKAPFKTSLKADYLLGKEVTK